MSADVVEENKCIVSKVNGSHLTLPDFGFEINKRCSIHNFLVGWSVLYGKISNAKIG
jgi:hypothetical protein